MFDISKKTKIVCTIGPATESEKCLIELLKSGMNVMRLNFSHGDFAEQGARVVNLRKAIKKTGIPCAIFQDLGGPKIRIGTFKENSVLLEVGKLFTFTTDKIEGDENKVWINYPAFPKEVKKGHIVFLHDGKKKLEVVEVKGHDVTCKILVGGEIKGKRGVNLPDSDLSLSSLTEKDIKDVEFGIKNKVDYIALSFVRKPSDILELREILKKRKCKAGIVAKIETPQAIKNLDEIIRLADAVMVARGDMAIELPAENVPMLQKTIIKKCNELAKPVITATQMLESMIKSPVPTRAEVSDVANAIIDGTDAVMLSEETTLGEFPVEAVKVMTRIAKRLEADMIEEQFLIRGQEGGRTVGESMNSSAVKTADRINAKYLVSLTNSGYGARKMSRHKPHQPIFVFTTNDSTYNKVCLSYACNPIRINKFKDYNQVLRDIRTFFLKNKLAFKGDKVVIATGMPFGKIGETNMILVEIL